MGEYLDSPSDENIYISPHYQKKVWLGLDLKNPDNHDWKIAVKIFWDRINGRFLIPIDTIINHPDREVREFSGFIVIAIDCLLIETLNQFYRGEDKTSGKHSDAFWEFFNRSKFFQKEITKDEAKIFYEHFRCGILHQAQTKKLSRIRIDRPAMVENIKQGDLSAGLIIDRCRFHQALLNEISDYATRLESPTTESDYDFRSKFVDKMSFIAK